MLPASDKLEEFFYDGVLITPGALVIETSYEVKSNKESTKIIVFKQT